MRTQCTQPSITQTCHDQKLLSCEHSLHRQCREHSGVDNHRPSVLAGDLRVREGRRHPKSGGGWTCQRAACKHSWSQSDGHLAGILRWVSCSSVVVGFGVLFQPVSTNWFKDLSRQRLCADLEKLTRQDLFMEPWTSRITSIND